MARRAARIALLATRAIAALAVAATCAVQASAQQPAVAVAGGAGRDAFTALANWPDSGPGGGLVVVGETTSPAGLDMDGWVLAFDGMGGLAFDLALGGPGDDAFTGVAVTPDGGLIVVGHTTSFGAGGQDAWVVRLAADGSVVWQRAYGHDTDDVAADVANDARGGFVVAGTWGPEGALLPTAWLLELRGDGRVQREIQRQASATAWSHVHSVAVTSDRGVLLAGTHGSPLPAPDPDVSRFNVVKLTPSRQLDWLVEPQEGGFPSLALDAIVRADGTLVAVGHHSDPDPVTPSVEGRVVSMTADGVVDWTLSLGLDGDDSVAAVAEMAGGGLAIAGSVTAVPGEPPNVLLAVLRADGTLDWAQSVPATGHDELRAVAVLPNGTLVAAGSTTSFGDPAGDAILVSWPRVFPSPGCGGLIDPTGVSPLFFDLERSTDPARFPLVQRTGSSEVDTSLTATALTTVFTPCVEAAPPDEVSPPGAVQPLVFVGPTSLAWAEAAASGSEVFNLYRGDVSALRAGPAADCLAGDLPAPAGEDLERPGAGGAWFYLVAGRNVAGDGPLGRSSRLTPRLSWAACP